MDVTNFQEANLVDYERGELRMTSRRGPPLRVGNLDGPGVLLELGDALRVAA